MTSLCAGENVCLLQAWIHLMYDDHIYVDTSGVYIHSENTFDVQITWCMDTSYV